MVPPSDVYSSVNNNGGEYVVKLDFSKIDVRAEMEEYDWEQPTWSDAKLIARSPFRPDNSPSFYVHFTGEAAGTWGDSGGYDEWAKGGLVKLLAYLRDETTEEVYDYLSDKYGIREIAEGDLIKLPSIALTERKGPTFLPETILEALDDNFDYLIGRGISEETQRRLGIKYNARSKSVAFPWRHINGQLANVKYRNTDKKLFFYENDGISIRTLVFGLDIVYNEGIRKVAVCEAEVDALSLWEVGLPAIALGTSSMSPEQAELILKSPIDHLVIATDADAAGDKVAKQIKELMGGMVHTTRKKWQDGNKDANDALMKSKGMTK